MPGNTQVRAVVIWFGPTQLPGNGSNAGRERGRTSDHSRLNHRNLFDGNNNPDPRFGMESQPSVYYLKRALFLGQHGRHDPVVPQQSIKFAAALEEAAGKAVHLDIFENM